jgi:hypothetical protein
VVVVVNVVVHAVKVARKDVEAIAATEVKGYRYVTAKKNQIS